MVWTTERAKESKSESKCKSKSKSKSFELYLCAISALYSCSLKNHLLLSSHSDDDGLVLPPAIAPHQVVVVPIYGGKKTTDAQIDSVNEAVQNMVKDMEEKGIRVKVDDRDYVRNGAKYFEWERKGVPLRIEVGPRDAESGTCVFKYRVGDTEKIVIPLGDVGSEAKSGLDGLQEWLLEKSGRDLEEKMNRGEVTYEEMRGEFAVGGGRCGR